jgi:hypothetical protein
MNISRPSSPQSFRDRRARRALPSLLVLCLAGLLVSLLQSCSSNSNQTGAGGAGGEPQSFTSPDEAVNALTRALRADDTPRLLSIMGSQGDDIVSSGDDVSDRQRRQKFLKLYDEKHSLENQGSDSVTLVVGSSDWPFPVPIVHRGSSWVFDSEAGREEIINRRIGENELSSIETCKAIADAQREFALQTQTPDGLHEYARQFASDPGKHNGLYWPTAEGEEPSPLGDLVVQAASEGYTRRAEGPTPYHGYCFRILQAQGPNAPDGALDYVVNGRMILGFALVAYPADYGNSGIMTFIMGPDGVVYQKNLGEQTETLAREMKAFDPGEGWKKVE